jgi:hypothetical protein
MSYVGCTYMSTFGVSLNGQENELSAVTKTKENSGYEG